MAWRGWFIWIMLTASLLAGCIGGTDSQSLDVTNGALLDPPLERVADLYYDVGAGQPYAQQMAEYLGSGVLGGDVRYHTLDEVEAKLDVWNTTHPDLVEIDVVGESYRGLPIWRVIVTNERAPAPKFAPLLDGGHHGNEYSGSEIMLYTVDFLLQNRNNATVAHLLETLEIHVIPVVNPDGYETGTRYNGNGVNLNRNYDVDWGNPAGTSNPVMGVLGDAVDRPVSGVTLVAENCGAHAASEPETQAIVSVMEQLGDRAAFYLTGHTPTHAVIAPPAAFDPPFTVPDDHRTILDNELDWIRTNTEYEAGRAQWGDMSAGLPYAASGSSMDYFYATLSKPAFTVEVEYFATSVTADDYPERLTRAHEGLSYWMDATLPLPMHLLANAASLADWEAPSDEAIIPEGHEVPKFPGRPVAKFPYLH